MKKSIIFVTIAAVFLVPALQGCATSSRTSSSETTTYRMVEDRVAIEGNRGNFPGGEISTGEKNAQAKVVKKTQIKEERKTGEPGGILGTTFHFIGQALAFPFKVIAGIIEFIF